MYKVLMGNFNKYVFIVQILIHISIIHATAVIF